MLTPTTSRTTLSVAQLCKGMCVFFFFSIITDGLSEILDLSTVQNFFLSVVTDPIVGNFRHVILYRRTGGYYCLLSEKVAIIAPCPDVCHLGVSEMSGLRSRCFVPYRVALVPTIHLMCETPESSRACCENTRKERDSQWRHGPRMVPYVTMSLPVASAVNDPEPCRACVGLL